MVSEIASDVVPGRVVFVLTKGTGQGLQTITEIFLVGIDDDAEAVEAVEKSGHVTFDQECQVMGILPAKSVSAGEVRRVHILKHNPDFDPKRE